MARGGLQPPLTGRSVPPFEPTLAFVRRRGFIRGGWPDGFLERSGRPSGALLGHLIEAQRLLDRVAAGLPPVEPCGGVEGPAGKEVTAGGQMGDPDPLAA